MLYFPFREPTPSRTKTVTSYVASKQGTGSQLRFTNLSTKKALSTKSNGAVASKRYNLDGSYTETDTGHNILILYPTDVPAGPSTTLIVGRVVFTVDTNGVFTVQEVSGRETDIYAALSS